MFYYHYMLLNFASLFQNPRSKDLDYELQRYMIKEGDVRVTNNAWLMVHCHAILIKVSYPPDSLRLIQMCFTALSVPSRYAHIALRRHFLQCKPSLQILTLRKSATHCNTINRVKYDSIKYVPGASLQFPLTSDISSMTNLEENVSTFEHH